MIDSKEGMEFCLPYRPVIRVDAESKNSDCDGWLC